MPEIDTVEFKIMTDSNAVLMALKSGDLDIASVDARNFSSLGKDFTSVEGPQNMVQIFALNNSVEPLNKKEVRQAINYAVNKEEIIQTVMEGHGTQLESFLSPSMKNYYNDDIKGYDTNIGKAKELLAEGWLSNWIYNDAYSSIQLSDTHRHSADFKKSVGKNWGYSRNPGL